MVLNTENLDTSDEHDKSGEGANLTEDVHSLKISDECNLPK